MHPKLLALAVVSLTAVLTGQQTVVIPANAAGAEGSTANNFPFGFTNPIWPGLRIQAVYDSSNLTSQGVTGPVTITRIRWRTNGGNAPAGGTFSNATVALGTAAVDYSAITTDFAANASSLTTVYSGPITVDPVAASTPGGWYVTVQTAPFVYDPSQGADLIIDTDHDLVFTGGGSASHDISGAGSMASRVFASSNYPAANGTTQDHGVVVELEYTPVECFLLLGLERINLVWSNETFLVNPLLIMPMDLANLPTFDLPNNNNLIGLPVFTQSVMYNPFVFPNDPIRVSQGLEFRIGLQTTQYGQPGGLLMWPIGSVVAQPGGQIAIDFTFL